MAAKVVPISVPPGSSRQTEDPPSQSRNHIPEPDIDTLNRFSDARMRLEALLDALYCVGSAGRVMEIDSGTVTTLASMAEDQAKTMDEIFEAITASEVRG